MTDSRRRRGLPSLTIGRPIGTLMATSVVLVLGFFFLARLPLDLLPSIVYPQVRVNVNNRGVEPEVLEETVAKPLEAALATTEDLARIETEVQEGRVGLNLHFNYGTNIDFALQDAAKNLERARGSLPEEADPPTIFKFDPSQIPIYEVAFSSPTRDLISLRDWVEYRLRPQLLTIEGVASVDVSGGLIREVQVVLDQERLRSYGLTVSQVIEAIRAANQDVAAGRVASATREVVGKTAGKFRNVEEIRSLVLPVAGGGRVPLSEIAVVRDTNQEQRMWVRLDGVPAVKMSIRKQPDANTVAVADEVNARLEQLESSGFLPGDIHHEVTQNQADFIRGSVNSVRNAALSGAFLAMMVVLLFLGSLRKTFVIGMAIPIAVLGTFVMMGLSGLTLNIMSLGGLALGVGLLIDNSIVMLENIFRHREEGNEDPEQAARTAMAAMGQRAIVPLAAQLKSDAATQAIPVVVVTSKILTREEEQDLQAKSQAILSKATLSRDIVLKTVTTLDSGDKIEFLGIYAPEKYTRDINNVLASPNFEDVGLMETDQDLYLTGLTWRRLVGESAPFAGAPARMRDMRAERHVVGRQAHPLARPEQQEQKDDRDSGSDQDDCEIVAEEVGHHHLHSAFRRRRSSTAMATSIPTIRPVIAASAASSSSGIARRPALQPAEATPGMPSITPARAER